MKKAELFSPLMLERFWNKIEKTSSCWNWKGAKNVHGGIVSVNGKRFRPHRLSYTIQFGEIPKNKVVMQTCENMLCVNPEHLMLANVQNQEIKKTHCPQGHPYSGINSEGKRICRECINARMKDRYHNKEGQKEYQLNYQASHKAEVNQNSKNWRKVNKVYFTEYERSHPRSGTKYPPEERKLMTIRRRTVDKNHCQWSKCTKSGTGLSVHHIFPRKEYPNLPVELRFLITYCHKHHADFHKARGDEYWTWIAAAGEEDEFE